MTSKNPPITTSDNDLSIPISFTKPDSIKYHWIEDKELEALMKVNAPISKIVAFGCLGYVIGEITTIAKLFEKSICDKSDIISLIILSTAFAGFVITGIYSFIGKSEIEKILEDIRSRKTTPLSVTKEE
jgi:hypothetical protein